MSEYEDRHAYYEKHTNRLQDYDLTAAFEYNSPIKYAEKEYTLDDIAEVLYKQKPGVQDEDCEWIVRLVDGEYAYLSGWCDYTGWD